MNSLNFKRSKGLNQDEKMGFLRIGIQILMLVIFVGLFILLSPKVARTQMPPPVDTGEWFYCFGSISDVKGTVGVYCSHEDAKGKIWSSY